MVSQLVASMDLGFAGAGLLLRSINAVISGEPQSAGSEFRASAEWLKLPQVLLSALPAAAELVTRS